MEEVSYAVSMVSRVSPRVSTERTRPMSVTMPVNMRGGFSS